jgi:hypothetical protein
MYCEDLLNLKNKITSGHFESTQCEVWGVIYAPSPTDRDENNENVGYRHRWALILDFISQISDL